MGKVLFMLIDGKLIYLHQDDGDHREWYESLGLDLNEFDNVIRGFILEGKIVFYKGMNFNYDEDVIRAAEQYGKEIRKYMKDPHLEVWCGVTVQGFGIKWEPIMQIREDELSGVSNVVSEKEEIKNNPIKKEEKELNDEPLIQFKNDFNNSITIKRAIFTTMVIMVLAVVTKIFMITMGTFKLSRLFDFLLLIGQFGSLGYSIHCYKNRLPVASYVSIGACILLAFSFNALDIIMAIFLFAFTLNQKPFEKAIDWLEFKVRDIKSRNK